MAKLKRFEVERPATVIELPCNQDGCDGFFRSTGFCDTSKGSCDYKHKCSKCGHTAVVTNKTYPRIKREDNED
jgi:hypothetical protein